MKKIFFNTPLFSIFLGVLIPVAVIVQWNKNIESDLAGYKIYWGTHSRAYTNVINAELDTSYTINDLPSGQIYFSVTAYDIAGNESDYSEEVTVNIENGNDLSSNNTNLKCYNFPNPFNPFKQMTCIRYFLELEQYVTINIYDMNENLVRNLLPSILKSRGEHTDVFWDGKSNFGNYVPNGIYYGIVKFGKEKNVIMIALVH